MTNFNLIKNLIFRKKLFILFLIISFIFISSFSFYYFNNVKISDYELYYKKLYYFLLFLYFPFSFFSMEIFFKSKEIIFLKNFAISNKNLSIKLILSLFLKLSPLYIFSIVSIFAFYNRDILFFKSSLLLFSIYHFLFIVIASCIYSYIFIFISNDDYQDIREAISGSWGNSRLAPILFAPALVLAIVNFSNIILYNVIERIFYQKTISLLLFMIILLSLFILLLFLSLKNLKIYLRMVYAIMNEYKNVYLDGSYNIEKKFRAELIINKFFKSISFLVLKDLKILKRRFRLEGLTIYFSSFIILIMYFSNFDFNYEIIISILYVFFTIPIIDIHYKPLEFSHFFFPVKKNDIIYSKLISTFIYIFPFIILLFVLSFRNLYFSYLLLLLILQNILINLKLGKFMLKLLIYLLLFSFYFIEFQI